MSDVSSPSAPAVVAYGPPPQASIGELSVYFIKVAIALLPAILIFAAAFKIIRMAMFWGMGGWRYGYWHW